MMIVHLAQARWTTFLPHLLTFASNLIQRSATLLRTRRQQTPDTRPRNTITTARIAREQEEETLTNNVRL